MRNPKLNEVNPRISIVLAKYSKIVKIQGLANACKTCEIDVVAAYGNSSDPLCWNYGIVYLGEINTETPLTCRRFVNTHHTGLTLKSRDSQWEEFRRSAVQECTFVDKKAHIGVIEVPHQLRDDSIPIIDEIGLSQAVIDLYHQKTRAYPHSEFYREQFRQAYQEAIASGFELALPNLEIGILDLPSNNPLMGIYTHFQIWDILKAFFSVKVPGLPKKIKLYFISEDLNQSYLIALALQMYMEKCKEWLSYPELSADIQRGQQQIAIPESQVRQSDLRNQFELEEVQNDSNRITLNLPKFQNQIQFSESRVKWQDREDLYPTPVLKDFFTIDTSLESHVLTSQRKKFNRCICYKPASFVEGQTFCCYCRQNKKVYLVCSDRQCGRKLCAGCKKIQPSPGKCPANHPMIFQVDESANFVCSQCMRTETRIQDQHFMIGRWQCRSCGVKFTLCACCQYNLYLDFNYERIKVYYQILKKLKPSCNSKIIYDLILHFMIDFDFDLLK